MSEMSVIFISLGFHIIVFIGKRSLIFLNVSLCNLYKYFKTRLLNPLKNKQNKQKRLRFAYKCAIIKQ